MSAADDCSISGDLSYYYSGELKLYIMLMRMHKMGAFFVEINKGVLKAVFASVNSSVTHYLVYKRKQISCGCRDVLFGLNSVRRFFRF